MQYYLLICILAYCHALTFLHRKQQKHQTKHHNKQDFSYSISDSSLQNHIDEQDELDLKAQSKMHQSEEAGERVAKDIQQLNNYLQDGPEQEEWFDHENGYQ